MGAGLQACDSCERVNSVARTTLAGPGTTTLIRTRSPLRSKVGRVGTKARGAALPSGFARFRKRLFHFRRQFSEKLFHRGAQPVQRQALILVVHGSQLAQIVAGAHDFLIVQENFANFGRQLQPEGTPSAKISCRASSALFAFFKSLACCSFKCKLWASVHDSE